LPRNISDKAVGKAKKYTGIFPTNNAEKCEQRNIQMQEYLNLQNK
jgi:hypothetical protein